MRDRHGGLSDLPYFYMCGIDTRVDWDWDWGTVAFTHDVCTRSCPFAAMHPIAAVEGLGLLLQFITCKHCAWGSARCAFAASRLEHDV